MVKLRRIFNLFSPIVWKEIGIIYGFCAVIFAILYFVGASDGDHTILGLGLFLIVTFPLVLAVLIFSAPKKLIYDENGVRFSIYQNVFVFKRNRLVKVDYDVCGLKDVEFSQNKLEKYFGVGHISFSGVVYFEARRYADRIKPKSRFTIYGIPDFERFIEEFPHKNK